ncbi:hypothetical protein ACVFYP_19605 [Roseomonas sp. F4]
MKEPNRSAIPGWLVPAWPRLIASRDAALAAGAPPEQALGAARATAAEILSPALPAYVLREAMMILAAEMAERDAP